ncbi:MAG: beta-glucuronidase [Pseudobutyrivibrio sp.]|nr:beta-glucuronidase [Pseudobutyrivibrio sp.]
MLYPQTNSCRSVFSLDGLWKFRLINDGFNYNPGDILTSDFEWIAVPASYNDQKEDKAYRRFAGESLYQRSFTLPKIMEAQRLLLRFDAVTNSARVYINSELITTHKGGYLPFEIDITKKVSVGVEFTISVVVDNRVNSTTLPVGNDKLKGAFFGSDNAQVPSVQKGKEYQADINLPNFDFFNYAGLNRSVRIYTTPKTGYIKDITVVTDIVGRDGVISYYALCDNDETVFATLKDKRGSVVATSDNGSIMVKDAKLWSIGKENAYLYTLELSNTSDFYSLSVGIRTIEVRGKQFLLNNQPVYFKGFGKHEDSHIKGRGFDLTYDVKDAGLIHWLGANSFRTSHYPYAEEMYDLCDREGILIIDETPAVGIAAGQANPYEVLDIRAHHEDVIKDMIARDKNHPCVIMWSMGNEPDTESYPREAYEYWHSLYDYTHSLDRQNRPVTFVCSQNDYTRDIVARTMDVVCLNRYYGWYNLSGDLDAAMYALNLELDFWEQQNKPVMLTEYGADTVSGMHATVPEMFSEEYQAQFLLAYGEAFDKRDFIIGEQMWNFADFGTIQGPMRAGGNKKGLFTRERKPKLAAHAMRHRWNNIPDVDYK